MDRSFGCMGCCAQNGALLSLMGWYGHPLSHDGFEIFTVDPCFLLHLERKRPCYGSGVSERPLSPVKRKARSASQSIKTSAVPALTSLTTIEQLISIARLAKATGYQSAGERVTWEPARCSNSHTVRLGPLRRAWTIDRRVLPTVKGR